MGFSPILRSMIRKKYYSRMAGLGLADDMNSIISVQSVPILMGGAVMTAILLEPVFYSFPRPSSWVSNRNDPSVAAAPTASLACLAFSPFDFAILP